MGRIYLLSTPLCHKDTAQDKKCPWDLIWDLEWSSLVMVKRYLNCPKFHGCGGGGGGGGGKSRII